MPSLIFGKPNVPTAKLRAKTKSTNETFRCGRLALMPKETFKEKIAQDTK